MIEFLLGGLVVFLAGAWVVLAVAVLYLVLLTVAAALWRRRLPVAARQRTFRVVIPAHDEALVIEPVLRRLMSVRYPRANFDVVVVADNCSDETAAVARMCGARVIERFDQVDRGKGHALAHAFSLLRSESFDAYVVLDADTLVDAELLEVFNRYLEAGDRVVQAHYDVLDPFQSRRTALMYVAFIIFNYVRPLGRRVLGASTGLKGNGMCFAKAVIDRYPWNAFSLAEDIEYTSTLLLNGEQVVFAPEARVWAQMPATRAQATSQRLRWEAGRLQMARKDGPRLLWQGLRRLNFQIFDWGMDLVIPPLAGLTLAIMIGTVLAGALSLTGAPIAPFLTVAWLGLALLLMLFVFAAMAVGRVPKMAYVALLSAPGFVAWKLWIYVVLLTRRAPTAWIRTDRTRIADR